MKKLVRGGVVLSLLSMFAVAIVYSQTKTIDAIIIANDSQAKVDTNTKTNLINTVTDLNSNTADTKKNSIKSDTKKLVKTTGSVRAIGASRGAFSATAYCLRGKTAMGHGVRRGIIAADPRVLKLGSTITISAGQWSGTYLVSDTGGRIKGKKLDIWVPSCSEARKFGRRSVQVQ